MEFEIYRLITCVNSIPGARGNGLVINGIESVKTTSI